MLAVVKHYAGNTQETNRASVNEMMDERTAFEMYYPPFQGAIDMNCSSVMCSYNLVNGVHSCENSVLLNKHLRENMGFKGYVMSDWLAAHSTSVDKGLDQE